MFFAHFNAGVRAVDIRESRSARRRSAITSRRSPTRRTSGASTIDGKERCKVAIQTNNVEVDDRGYIYIVDRANTGNAHPRSLAGEARKVADLP